MPRKPRLPKTLAIANGDTFDREAVALTPPPYPGWSAQNQRRRDLKGQLHDEATLRLVKYLAKPGKMGHDMHLVEKIAKDFDPDRLVLRGQQNAIRVEVVMVDEGATLGVAVDFE